MQKNRLEPWNLAVAVATLAVTIVLGTLGVRTAQSHDAGRIPPIVITNTNMQVLPTAQSAAYTPIMPANASNSSIDVRPNGQTPAQTPPGATTRESAIVVPEPASLIPENGMTFDLDAVAAAGAGPRSSAQ